MTAKNRNFIQLYRHNIDVFRVISHNPTAIEIVALVMKHMDNNNHVIATITQLCKATNKGKTAVYKAVTLLKDKKVIHVKNTGGTCIFICNPNFAWTSYAGSREKYAKLHAVVLVDETEIPDYNLAFEKKRGSLVGVGVIEKEFSNATD